MQPLIRWLVVLAGGLGLSAPVAATTITAQISYVNVYSGTAYALVDLVTAPTGKPGCATSSADYAFSMTAPRAREVLSALLMAHAAKRTVYVNGTGACDAGVGTVEGINTVRVYNY